MTYCQNFKKFLKAAVLSKCVQLICTYFGEIFIQWGEGCPSPGSANDRGRGCSGPVLKIVQLIAHSSLSYMCKHNFTLHVIVVINMIGSVLNLNERERERERERINFNI